MRIVTVANSNRAFAGLQKPTVFNIPVNYFHFFESNVIILQDEMVEYLKREQKSDYFISHPKLFESIITFQRCPIPPNYSILLFYILPKVTQPVTDLTLNK